MPVVVLGFGAALTHLLRAEISREATDLGTEIRNAITDLEPADPVPAAVPAAPKLPTHRQVREQYKCGPETAKKIRAGMAAAVKAASNGHPST